MQLRVLCQHLERIAPLALAEDWDNVGLLVGDPDRDVQRLMTCLTVTPDSVAEAIEKKADLILSHHPMPFRPTKRITTDETVGRLLWQLISSGIAVYSPHTAWDSAAQGINQQLAVGLGLQQVRPLIEPTNKSDEVSSAVGDHDSPVGSGRVGDWPAAQTLGESIAQVKQLLKVDSVAYVGKLQQPLKRVAIACGSAGSMLPNAIQADCDLMLLGETTFHTGLEAEAAGIALVLPGHFASERFSLEVLADRIASEHPALSVWACDAETNPFCRG